MSTDDFEMRSYDKPEAPVLETLRRRSKNGYIVGCLFMFSPIVLVIIAAVVPYSILGNFIIPLFGGGFILTIIGIVVLVMYGASSGSLIKAYEILQRLGPPEPVIGNRYAVKEYDGVYIIAKAFGNMLNFIAFRGQAGLNSASKMKVPGTYYAWEKKAEAGELKLFRKEGTFAVPTERGDIVSGEGVAYAESFMPSKGNWIVPDFTKEEMLSIIQKVKEDAMKPSLDQ